MCIRDSKISELNKNKKAKADKDFFKKVYPKETPKNITDFKSKIKEDIEKQFANQSDQKFLNDVTDSFIKNTKISLPKDFLKRLMKLNSKDEISDEDLEKEYLNSENGIKYQLIEEKLIIDSYLKFKESLNSLLVIVPRHPERFDITFNIARDAGLKVKRKSIDEKCSEDTEILIGDSMGEMMGYYSISDIAFIGGSLSDNGGQNMLEAASLSKPIIFGPSTYNFEEVSKQLLDNDASIEVANADELMRTITELLTNDLRMQELGANARKTFEDNQGAVNKTLDFIKPLIKA